jgi:hypothetical protein
MNKRKSITLLGGAAAAWPLAARAQVSSRLPLVAWLSGGARPASLGFVDAFLQGMRELGYIESRSFDVVYRYADGYAERLPTLAQELVQLKPKVILAAATGGCGSSGVGRQRSSAGWKCHWNNALCGWLACQTAGACTRDRARRT